MFLFVLIFLMITPAFSMGVDDPDLADALAESLRDYERVMLRGGDRRSPSPPVDDEFEQARLRSIDPMFNVRPGDISPGESDDEETMLQEAIAMSVQGHAAGRSMSPFESLLQKGRTATTEVEFLRGLDNKNASANLIGYMVFLKNKDKRRFDTLMLNVDSAEWNSLYQKLALGRRTANNVFIHLDEVKKLILRQRQASVTALLELVDQIDHVMLELLSGKWGFSRTKLASDIKAKLQDAAVGIGRDLGNKTFVPAQCAATIFQYFNKGPLVQTTSDLLLRKHRLAAFAYMANGYRQGLIPDNKEVYSAQLAEVVLPYFKPEDLKGFSLDALIQAPAETLTKIAKVSTTSFAQQTVFDKFTGPLKSTALAADLVKLKAFLGAFDPGNIYEILANEDQVNSLKLLQRALQGKMPQEIQAIINSLIENDLLPAQVRDIQDLLVESASYSSSSSIDRIYPSSMQTVRLTRNKDAEPSAGTNRQDLDTGLLLWILEYFNAIYENGYYPREAYIVKYPGILDGREFSSDEEVTEAQAVKASEHMAVYVLANQLKETVGFGNAVGQKTVLSLIPAGAKVDLVNEMDERVLATRNIDNLYAPQIATIRAKVNEYNIDPNVLPPGIEKKSVPSKRPKKAEYAVRGGDGVSPLQQIQSRGLAIDVLIKEGRISRNLKLPILLYLDSW